MIAVMKAARRYDAVSQIEQAHAMALVDALALVCKRSSQKEVAQTLGVSPQYMNDIIRGRRALSDEFVARILEAKV